jgi:hypothetical protein
LFEGGEEESQRRFRTRCLAVKGSNLKIDKTELELE